MRKAAVSALIAVLMTILSPVCINYAPAEKGVSLINLDVCNLNGHFAPIGAQSPCIYEKPFALHIPQTVSSVPNQNKLLMPFLLTFQKDRPPAV